MIVWIPAATLGLAALMQRREEKQQDEEHRPASHLPEEGDDEFGGAWSDWRKKQKGRRTAKKAWRDSLSKKEMKAHRSKGARHISTILGTGGVAHPYYLLKRMDTRGKGKLPWQQYADEQGMDYEPYGAVASWMGGRGPTRTGVAGWMGGRVRTGAYASGIEDEMLEEDRYGMLIAAPILVDALVLSGLALTVYGSYQWVTADKGDLVNAVRDSFAKAAAWATGSAAAVASYEVARQIAHTEAVTAAATAAAAGISIPKKCAWILSPYLIFDRVVALTTTQMSEVYTAEQIATAATAARAGAWGMGTGPMVQLIRKLLENGSTPEKFALGAMSLAGGLILLFFAQLGTVNMMLLFDKVMPTMIGDIAACSKQIGPSVGARASAAVRTVLAYLKNFRVFLYGIRLLRLSGPFILLLKTVPITVSIAACVMTVMSLLALIGILDKEDADDIWELLGPTLEGHGITQEMIEDMLPGEDSEEAESFRVMLKGAIEERLIEDGEAGAMVLAGGKAKVLIAQAKADGMLSEWTVTHSDRGSESEPMKTVLIPLSGDVIFDEGPVPDGFYNVAHVLPGEQTPVVLPAYRHRDPSRGDLRQKGTGGIGVYSTTSPTMVRLRKGTKCQLEIISLSADPKARQYVWTVADRPGRSRELVFCGGGSTGMDSYWEIPVELRSDVTVDVSISVEVLERYPNGVDCKIVARDVQGVVAGTEFVVPCEADPGKYDIIVNGNTIEKNQELGFGSDSKGCPFFLNFR